MGGDGGVIAANRRYMRGAGTADHTGDATRNDEKSDPTIQREEAARVMRTCAVSNEPLQFDQTVVVCPYGRLYNKEAAVEALLRRKQEEKDGLGSHIRGLKDLHEIRFHFTGSGGKRVPACPVIGRELNGQVPAYVLIPGTVGQVNAVSERAIKEMGEQALLEEYGPGEEKILLAPPPSVLKEIKEALELKRDGEKAAKKSKKGKKRLKDGTGVAESKKKKVASVSDAARARVSTAVESNNVLSSLFTSSEANLSEKEKKDRLFAG